jgi:hypothetical protein
MIASPKEPQKVKIEKMTFLKVDPELDKEFEEFLEFMEISFVVKGVEGTEWPLVEYEGLPHDIVSMLDSRFGMSKEEIKGEYPQLFS